MIDNKIQELEKFLLEDPDDAFVLYALALEYVKSGENNKALAFFSTLADKHPDYLPASYHYGKLCEKINEREKVNEIYLKGMELAKNQNEWKTFNEIKEAYNSLNGVEDDE